VIELLIAVIFEIFRAEPSEMIHPTVWFGKIAGFFDRKLPESMLAGLIPPFVTSIFAFYLSLIPKFLPDYFGVLLAGYLLYTTISIRSMVEHAEACMENGDVNPERLRMIVSRDVKSLNYWQRCSAVIESVSENLVDGVLAPLFYYAVFGLPGALIYRAINTCDAMLGYRKGRYEKFGKPSARLDDLLNFIPSRLSLLFYAMVSRKAFLCGLRKSPKINGHSISGMAGLLNVSLEKPGYYLIDCGKKPEMRDVVRSLRYFKLFSGMAVLSALLARMLV